jgi:tetratricopeptide (TPR) repeat protein
MPLRFREEKYMRQCHVRRFYAYGIILFLVGIAAGVFWLTPLAAQEGDAGGAPPDASAPQESLRLPEVVITGMDRTKIQRLIPKVTPPATLPVVTTATRDQAEALIREGNRFLLTQPRQAEERYQQARALDPFNSRIYLRLGEVARLLGKPEEAIAAYRKAAELAPISLEAHYQLGLLAENRQDWPQAREHYQKYLQLGGTDARVNFWLRELAQK